MHDGANHWLMTCCSNGRVQVCDSLRSSLSRVTKRCIKQLYQATIVESDQLLISLLPVQKQMNGWNCGLFSVAFEAELPDG